MLRSLFALLLVAPCVALSGCFAVGASSNGGFFIFPSVGVLVVILIVFLLLRRR